MTNGVLKFAKSCKRKLLTRNATRDSQELLCQPRLIT